LKSLTFAQLLKKVKNSANKSKKYPVLKVLKPAKHINKLLF